MLAWNVDRFKFRICEATKSCKEQGDDFIVDDEIDWQVYVLNIYLFCQQQAAEILTEMSVTKTGGQIFHIVVL